MPDHGFGRLNRLGGADIEPQPLMDEAVRALRRDRAVPEQIGRKRPLGRIDQQSRRQYLDAGKNERCHPVAPTPAGDPPVGRQPEIRSEEHTSELQSLMRISYAVFCLKKKTYSRKQEETS